MNAPVFAKHLQVIAATTQPTVLAGAELLYSGYEHGGLYVDLYGSRDEFGYEVEHVTLRGDANKVDIGAWLTGKQLEEMSEWCTDHLPSARALLLASRHEARIDRCEWERTFAAAPP